MLLKRYIVYTSLNFLFAIVHKSNASKCFVCVLSMSRDFWLRVRVNIVVMMMVVVASLG